MAVDAEEVCYIFYFYFLLEVKDERESEDLEEEDEEDGTESDVVGCFSESLAFLTSSSRCAERVEESAWKPVSRVTSDPSPICLVSEPEEETKSRQRVAPTAQEEEKEDCAQRWSVDPFRPPVWISCIDSVSYQMLFCLEPETDALPQTSGQEYTEIFPSECVDLSKSSHSKGELRTTLKSAGIPLFFCFILPTQLQSLYYTKDAFC